MRKNLVNERQPFGDKEDYSTMPSTLPTPAAHSNANLGTEMPVGNNGRTVVESFADKNPGAYDAATRNRSNPFAFVGHKFEDSRVNLVGRQTNAI